MLVHHFSSCYFTSLVCFDFSYHVYFILLGNHAIYTIWGMAWLELLMKVVASCDKLGVGACIC